MSKAIEINAILSRYAKHVKVLVCVSVFGVCGGRCVSRRGAGRVAASAGVARAAGLHPGVAVNAREAWRASITKQRGLHDDLGLGGERGEGQGAGPFEITDPDISNFPARLAPGNSPNAAAQASKPAGKD